MSEPTMFAGIYVNDVPKTARIFKHALRAKAKQLQPNLVELTVGKDRLLINERTSQIQQTSHNSAKELELGVWVDDLEKVYETITTMTVSEDGEGIAYVSEIEEKHSGIKDFRFKLPEGYYVRVTAEAN